MLTQQNNTAPYRNKLGKLSPVGLQVDLDRQGHARIKDCHGNWVQIYGADIDQLIVGLERLKTSINAAWDDLHGFGSA